MTSSSAPLQVKQGDMQSQEFIRLRWLIRIRWAAFACLAVIFLGADYVLELGLYTRIIVEILGLGFLSNVFLMWVNRRPPEFPDLIAGLTLIFDVLLLAGLLFDMHSSSVALCVLNFLS